MKKTLMLIFAAGVLASCGDTSSLGDELTNAMDEAIDEASADSKATGDVLTVAELNKALEEDPESVTDKTITVEGYYLNYNSQKSDDGFDHSISLYEDESCDFKGQKVFFFMDYDNADEFKGIPQNSKLKISGKVTGEKFFNSPEVADAKIVK
ncbi:MAG: hypothetical protein HWE22_02625 [Flavobacteriales bacterium]|nr:hypothetical protein [Flavobacteriales bacterium]